MQVPHKQTVDIDFRDISYTITKYKQHSSILKNVNGCFRSGNLIGILGPSGAGKTTLLKVLAGYINKDVCGVIKMNGQIRDMRKFKKLSCFIMQEDIVQNQLSVNEIMELAANLKLGNRYKPKEKGEIIQNVMQTIGLQSSLKTRTENLSGGQLKRLAMALELVNNPPVMFLDEPTTGLDNVVARQCIEVLKTLASQGRTIICTIHQPSDSLFSFFDQVYFMSSGYCVYNGSISGMVPFLKDIHLPCPTNYSPADFIIEIVHNNEKAVQTLSTVAKNGLAEFGDNEIKKGSQISTKNDVPEHICLDNAKDYEQFLNPFHVQVIILMRRMFMQMSRNKMALTIQLMHHTVCSLCIGSSFYGIGDNAAEALAIFKFYIVVIVFYCYTYLMSPILLFPFEIELVRREYFNRWYSLKAYYTALTISTIPFMVILSVLFNIIIYTLTNQPLEMRRFFLFNVICILITLNTYALGITIGSMFKSTVGACVGAIVGYYLLLISIYGMGYGDTISPFVKTLMLMVYPRHGLNGLCATLLQNRDLLKCEELFCYIRDPEELLEMMGMGDTNINFTICVLISYLVFLRFAAYVVLKRKVSPDSRLICKYI